MEEIKVLLDIGDSILSNINKLKELELKGKSSSSEFHDIVNMIINQRLLEKSLLNKLTIDNEKIKELLFKEIYEDKSILILNLNIVELDNKKIIKLRLYNMLNNKVFIPELEYLKRFGIDYNELVNVKNAIYDDIIMTIIYILNSYLNNYEYSKVKDKIIDYKYNLVFLNDSILDSLLSNGFNLNQNLYWAHMLYHNDITNGQIEYTKSVSAIDMLQEYSPFVVTNSDKDIIALLQSYIRTAFLFLSEKEFELFKEEMLKLINDMKENYDNTDDNFNFDLFYDCFKYYEMDKELPNILSLKK